MPQLCSDDILEIVKRCLFNSDKSGRSIKAKGASFEKKRVGELRRGTGDGKGLTDHFR